MAQRLNAAGDPLETFTEIARTILDSFRENYSKNLFLLANQVLSFDSIPPRGKKGRERHQFHRGERAARHSRAAQATIQARRPARTGGCILGRAAGHRGGSDLEPECADSRP